MGGGMMPPGSGYIWPDQSRMSILRGLVDGHLFAGITMYLKTLHPEDARDVLAQRTGFWRRLAIGEILDRKEIEYRTRCYESPDR